MRVESNPEGAQGIRKRGCQGDTRNHGAEGVALPARGQEAAISACVESEGPSEGRQVGEALMKDEHSSRGSGVDPRTGLKNMYVSRNPLR